MLELEMFKAGEWQMSLGERAALEGMLSELKPECAIEIGSAQGGSLQRVAAHARTVHSFDLVAPTLAIPSNVALHTGDSHELLPAVLMDVVEKGKSVDFVLVDGDHSSEGVRQDIEDLLESPALARTVIAIHDTSNEVVRAGLDAIHYAAWPKVAYVDLDLVGGRLFCDQELRNELWGGLGVIVVDSRRLAYTTGLGTEERHYPAGKLLAGVRKLAMAESPQSSALDVLASALDVRGPGRATAEHEEQSPEKEQALVALIGELEGEILRLSSVCAHHEALWRELMNSASWKLTAPLRFVASLARRLTRRG
jgi:Methyltransferase domain